MTDQAPHQATEQVTEQATEQAKVFDYLSRPASHGMASAPLRVDTHGAAVFLAGNDVYKIKRAIAYPYMDFSTLEKRKAACDAEVRVNRAYAPDIYLGTLPITRDETGLHIGGDGKIVEWSVHMRRFDEEATLDRLADRDALDATIIDRLAQCVSDVHAKAPLCDGIPAVKAFHQVIVETLGELKERKDIFPASMVAALDGLLLGAYRGNEQLLLRRAADGKVRRCHGDLHLRNIVLQNGNPVLFDAIEFDESIAAIDILYDLAFLVMDLSERGFSSQACRLLNRYLWLSQDELEDIESLALLPMFLALRAAIRAKVLAAQAEFGKDPLAVLKDAWRYCDVALGFVLPVSRALVAIGGLSGTGKTILAAAISPDFGAAPGALHLRSDIERKKACGAPEFARLAADAYGPAMSDRIYRRLGELAKAGLEAGRWVMIDATFQQETERDEIAAIARQMQVKFAGLWLEAPLQIRKERVSKRKNDASDATEEVVVAQAAAQPGSLAWHKIDASAPAAETARAGRDLLEAAFKTPQASGGTGSAML